MSLRVADSLKLKREGIRSVECHRYAKLMKNDNCFKVYASKRSETNQYVEHLQQSHVGNVNILEGQGGQGYSGSYSQWW